jgi:hypothetical protein
MTAETTAPKQRGRPFAKGKSGNPNGRPVGARNRATLAAEVLLDGEAEKLTRMAVALALKGNVACLRLCFDRIFPPRRDRLVRFTMPALSSADDAAKAVAAMTAAVARGELAPTSAVAYNLGPGISTRLHGQESFGTDNHCFECGSSLVFAVVFSCDAQVERIGAST